MKQSHINLLMICSVVAALAQSVPGAIVINEIHYDPDLKLELVEFVELYNSGASAVDLSGAYFDDGIDYTFPPGTTIDPGGYLVVAQNPPELLARYGATALGPYIGTLKNSGERVRLRSVSGTTLDEVDYSDHFPWPTKAGGGGSSMELLHPELDNDVGASWRSSSIPGTSENPSVFVASGSSGWWYRKGTSEPPSDWMDTGFIMNGSWLSGTASIGYGDGDDVTVLNDMKNNYSSFYLRHDFVVTDAGQIVGQGTLDHYLDDGAIIYLNGTEVTRPYVSGGNKNHDSLSGVNNDAAWETFSIANLADYLVVGTNTLAVHMLNSSLSSSDISCDLGLKTAAAGGLLPEPTPGTANSVAVAGAPDAPPAIRQVGHTPEQPTSADVVAVTAKVTDPDGVGSVTLQYQLVEPGSYIPIRFPNGSDNPDYEDSANWSSVTMYDDGTHGDALAGDSIYTAELPAGVQGHRNLVRYRITVADDLANSQTVPYADDEQPNFAYFIYDGVPSYTADGVTYSATELTSVRPIHVLSRGSDISTCHSGGETDYIYPGTVIYDGEVYDHVFYRIKGAFSYNIEGKKKWKFNFNRGHRLKMRDNFGKRYKEEWDKLNLSGGTTPYWQEYGWDHGVDGMILNEVASFRFFSLAGIPSPNTSFLHVRVVDDASENGADQYSGDFWGLYIGVEQGDSRFIDAHNLPDGNLYKMAGSAVGANQGAGEPDIATASDVNAFVSGYKSHPEQAWWEATMNMENYYSYHTVDIVVNNSDARPEVNCYYYHNPITDQWHIIPWDLDLTYEYATHYSNNEYLRYSIEDHSELNQAYENRAREIQDLLFNGEQAAQVLDELAAFVGDPLAVNKFHAANRSRWEYDPYVVSKGRSGRYYKSDYFDNFPEVVSYMKDYISVAGLGSDYGGGRLTAGIADLAIPDTPTLTYTGDTGYPLNGLSFQCSAFSDPQGSGTFAAMQWRAGEVLDAAAPAYTPGEPSPYEITAKWESGELASYNSDITIPSTALKVGHAYRVRVRMKDDSGRWSHWSNPVEFVITEPSTAGALVSHLRVSEVMFDPAGGTDYEFVELHNTDTNLALILDGAAFTSGIDYSFPGGTTIEPAGYLLVIGTTNTTAFRAHYGLSGSVPVAGAFSGRLSNSGEELRLKTASGGSPVASFTYSDGRTWPLAAAGAGHSLVPVDPSAAGQATGALDYPGNWRFSTYTGGSPGAADPDGPSTGVVINEITAHTDYSNPSKPEYDSNDWIELLNTTGTNINLSGWYLSDDASNPAKWAIPAVDLPAGGRMVFNEVDDFHSPITSGFGLDKAGEQVLLSHLPGTSADRVVDAVGFKGQENGSSLSRYPDADEFLYATTPTEGTANSVPYDGLRLTEIMYQPTIVGTNDNVRDEYIEIHNPTLSDITLQNVDEAWRVNGGVDYTFPDNTVVAAGERLLVVSFDPVDTATSNAFVTAYGITNAVRFFGPFIGKLGNRSERISLEKPQLPDLVGDAYSWVIEDETVYGNQNPWPVDAAGAGQALARISTARHGRDPANWQATAPSPGSAGADTDDDGMPNEWEELHDLNPSDGADAWIDSDGDGLTNLEEYLSGTDPQDPASALKFDWIGPSNTVMVLQFTAMADRTYSILYRDTLSAGSWQMLTNISAGAGTVPVEVFDPAASTNGACFYRLEIPAAP